LAILGLVFCFPVGLILVLLTRWSTRTKLIVDGAAVGVVVLFGIVGVAAGSPTPSAPAARVNSPTPAKSALATPTPTPKPQFAVIHDGIHKVGSDVQPGTYRTRSNSSGCYFARLKGFSGQVSDIISNANTDGPAVVTIDASDAGFESRRCATWTADLSQITKSKTSFGEGTYFVGTDIDPGTYRNSGGSGCYYARLRGFGGTIGDIVANDNTDAAAIVTIDQGDKGFTSARCGTWTKS